MPIIQEMTSVVKVNKKLASNRLPIIIGLTIIQAAWFAFVILKLTTSWWWVNLLLQVLSFIALMVVINRNDNPAYKLAWAVPILAFPVFGGLLYLMIGGKKPSRKIQRKMDESWKIMSKYLFQDEKIFDSIKSRDTRTYSQLRYIYNSSHYPVYGNSIARYYKNGEDVFPDMLDALRNAQRYILIEYFIIAEGTMWSLILDILKEKAKAGLDVRLIYDDLGCVGRLADNFKEELANFNIKSEVFNPVSPILDSLARPRDHRKIMVIDGHTGFIGGINIADEYINKTSRFGYWKDSCMQITGDAVHSLAVMFFEMWYSLRSDDKALPIIETDLKKGNNDQYDSFIQPYADSPLNNENVGRNVYLNMINMAMYYVYLFTPYLIIDNELMTALCLAAKRGVDVRIVTPGIPDKRIVFAATQSYFLPLSKSGVKVYNYTPGFLHSKCSICDDKIATVGTINLDYRSLYLNFECGVYLYGTSAINAIKTDFLETMEKCTLVDEKQIRRNFSLRLGQSILRLFAPIL